MSHDRANVNRQFFVNNMRRFIEQWLLLPNKANQHPHVHKKLDPSRLGIFVDDFQPALQRLRSSGAMANVWEAAGLKRNEVRVASSLNWFLDSLADHGQEHLLCLAVLEYLDVLVANSADKNKFVKFPKASHLLNARNRPCYRATTEVCPLGERDNRVDIEINGTDLLLFVEVKIDAGQGIDQLRRYHSIAEKKSAGRHWGVVYLTHHGQLPENEQSLSNTIGLSWRDVATAFQKHAVTLGENNLARHYIKQYADFIVNL